MTDDQTAESMRVLANVNRLVGTRGVTFRNSIVQFSFCCPSRATYLTGQYAHNHGVLANEPPYGGFSTFAHQETTFPVALQNAGYHTVHIGKYLNGYGTPPVVPPGWSEWYGSVDPSTYRYFGYSLNENGTLTTFGRSPTDYQTDVYADIASKVVREQQARNDPLFLNVAFLAPHVQATERRQGAARVGRSPAVPAPRHAGHFAREPLPQPLAFDEGDVSDKPEEIRELPRLARQDEILITRHYRAELESLLAVDEAVARVVDALETAGQLDDTIMIFTSDNGYMHGEHRIAAGKGVLYEPAIQVPLLMSGPGIARGATRDELVANIDLAPTILELAQATPLRTVDGQSLVPLLQQSDEGVPWSRDVLLDSGGPLYLHNSGIRTSRYMYVELATHERELYDLRGDPQELRNRAGDPSLRSVQADLARRLAILKTCAGASCRR
jgi:arylsulfatase A-like enzyme